MSKARFSYVLIFSIVIVSVGFLLISVSNGSLNDVKEEVITKYEPAEDKDMFLYRKAKELYVEEPSLRNWERLYLAYSAFKKISRDTPNWREEVKSEIGRHMSFRVFVKVYRLIETGEYPELEENFRYALNAFDVRDRFPVNEVAVLHHKVEQGKSIGDAKDAVGFVSENLYYAILEKKERNPIFAKLFRQKFEKIEEWFRLQTNPESISLGVFHIIRN